MYEGTNFDEGKIMLSHLRFMGRANKEAGLALLEEVRNGLNGDYRKDQIQIDSKRNIMYLINPLDESIDSENRGKDYFFTLFVIPCLQERRLMVLSKVANGDSENERTLAWFLEKCNQSMPESIKLKAMYKKHFSGEWYLIGIEEPKNIPGLIRIFRSQLTKDLVLINTICQGEVPDELKKRFREEYSHIEKEWEPV